MKQSEWLRSLSERAGFLHPARSETQLPAVKCNCPLWFSGGKKIGVKQFLNEKNCPKHLKNVRILTIVRYENELHQALKTSYYKHDVHQN
jgi:hypothetical protein